MDLIILSLVLLHALQRSCSCEKRAQELQLPHLFEFAHSLPRGPLSAAPTLPPGFANALHGSCRCDTTAGPAVALPLCFCTPSLYHPPQPPPIPPPPRSLNALHGSCRCWKRLQSVHLYVFALLYHVNKPPTPPPPPPATSPGLLNAVHWSCRCEKRAQDLQLPHLFVFARLALAQFALEHQTGSDQNPGSKPTPQLSGSSQGMTCGGVLSVHCDVAQVFGGWGGWGEGGGGGGNPS